MDADRQRKVQGEHSTRPMSNMPLSQTSSKKKGKNKYTVPPTNYHMQYDPSLNPCSMNWPPQPRIHPTQHAFQQQRLFSTSDPSVCHYSVPVSFSLEPVSLPVYPALFQSAGNSAMPLEPNVSRVKSHKKYNKNKKNVTNHRDETEVPAIFHMPRQNDMGHQDYASLPPVNCDIYSKQSGDTEGACKRRFSDPGLGQLSSDECSTSRSDESSSSSTRTTGIHDVLGLVEQINDLRDSNSQLMKELHEAKLELQSLKLLCESSYLDHHPGKLADAISEVRDAAKMREEALMSKVIHMFKENSSQCKEVHQALEQNLNNQQTTERLEKLEKQVEKLNESCGVEKDATSAKEENGSAVQQQLVDLEQEKLQLRKELQEAIASRKEAEASTQKLERLVSILRKKINGVSTETSIPDEKLNPIRPLSSTFDQNPFIIANNKTSPKFHPLSHQKRSNSIPQESDGNLRRSGPRSIEGIMNDDKANEENELKEQETCDLSSNSSGNSSSSSTPVHTPTEATSLTAQVTITGPVTDL